MTYQMVAIKKKIIIIKKRERERVSKFRDKKFYVASKIR
jgi:hypothetical protein